VELLPDVVFEDGFVEADLVLAPGRSFPGIVFRLVDDANYESFFLRPHQVGNDDAIQYTPVLNGLSAWQLYHGPGFWNAVSFPIGEALTIRAEFTGDRLRVLLSGQTVLDRTRLRRPPEPGRAGVAPSGNDLQLLDLRWEERRLDLPYPREARLEPGTVIAWEVSRPFAENETDAQLARAHEWTLVQAEASGLLDLARVNGIHDGANTVFARTTLESKERTRRPLRLGFSDRATVFLNGEALFRGEDGYRSRDYRFLGSIGWYDTVYLPLRARDNDLAIAVSEDFGGWGVQARFASPDGLELTR